MSLIKLIAFNLFYLLVFCFVVAIVFTIGLISPWLITKIFISDFDID